MGQTYSTAYKLSRQFLQAAYGRSAAFVPVPAQYVMVWIPCADKGRTNFTVATLSIAAQLALLAGEGGKHLVVKLFFGVTLDRHPIVKFFADILLTELSRPIFQLHGLPTSFSG